MLPQRDSCAAGTTVDGDVVCRLVRAMGRSDFSDTIGGEGRSLTGADQITAFVIDPQQVRCILAYRPEEDDLVVQLCRQYASTYFRRDSYLASCLESESELSSYRVSFRQVDDAAYRNNLYLAAGLASKLAVVSRAPGRSIYLNFYYRRDTELSASAAVNLSSYWRLLIECLSKHDLMTGGLFRDRSAKLRVEDVLRERFPVLSKREREVCARIATGHGAEAIALELGLSETTVITFRRRAYSKLGISSQAELFAHCAGLIAT